MNGLTRDEVGSILMERHGVSSLSTLDNNGVAPYCIYAQRSHQLEQHTFKWKPSPLLKVGKAGSITQRMRQFEQAGCSMRVEWLIWTSKKSARDVEDYVHSLIRNYHFHCPESVATETHTIDTDNSIFLANKIKNEICSRKDVLGMDIFDHDNTQKYTFREQTQKVCQTQQVFENFFFEEVPA